MAPLHLEARCFHVVRQILFALHRVEIRDVEITVILVAFLIIGLQTQSPGAFRVDFPKEL